MKNEINIDIKAGHLMRYLEAMRDGLTLMIDKMGVIRETYCEKCGYMLEPHEKQPIEDYVTKWCPNCMDGNRYIFPKR